MRPFPAVPRHFAWVVPAAVAWGWCVYALQPDGVIPYDDDVGYLRSVVLTLQHGWPWTDDWLEPWAASLSVLSAGAFRVSGSFTFAIQGVLALCAGAALVPLVALFRSWRIPALAALASSVVLLSAPTVLWKQMQYTSMALYVPALFLALLAVQRRQWGWFVGTFALAVAARQSAIAWLAMPAWVGIFALIAREKGRGLRPMLAVGAGILLYLALGWWMNETHAQRVMTQAMWSSVEPGRLLRGFIISAGVAATATGCGGFLIGCFGGNALGSVETPRRWVQVGVGVCVLVFCGLLPRFGMIECELPLRETVARGGYLWGVALLGALGWCLQGWRLRGEVVAAVMVAGVLAGLRGSLWDYYFLDAALLGLFAVQPCAGTCIERSRGSRCMAFAAVLVVATVALAQHWATAMRVKRVLDGSRALTVLCEEALRAGRIDPQDLSIAPFGHQVWHLYPHFIATVGADGRYIADFTGYLRPGALRVGVRGAPAGAIESVAVPSDGPVVASGIFRAMWSEHHEFTLTREPAPAAAELGFVPTEYVLQPFPLNDAEWRAMVQTIKPQAAPTP